MAAVICSEEMLHLLTTSRLKNMFESAVDPFESFSSVPVASRYAILSMLMDIEAAASKAPPAAGGVVAGGGSTAGSVMTDIESSSNDTSQAAVGGKNSMYR